MNRRLVSRCWTAVTVAAWLLCLSRAAFAADNSPLGGEDGFPIDPANPLASVPTQEQANANPMGFGYYLMELARLAEAAQKNGDRELHLAYWRAMSQAAPHKAIGAQKVCELVRERAYKNADPLEDCREVLHREGVALRDYEIWLGLVAAAKQADPTRLEDARSVLSHLRQDPTAKSMAARMECRIAVRYEAVAMMDSCVPELESIAPEALDTLVFAWHRALLRDDGSTAEELYEKIEEKGIAEAQLQQMRVAMKERLGRGFFGSLPLAALIFGVCAAGFQLYRRKRS